MKTKLGMLACAAVLTAGAMSVGCGDSSSTGGAGGTGTTATGTGSTTSSSSKSSTGTGTATTGTGTSTGTGGGVTCDSFCTKVMANCTGVSPQDPKDKVFADKAACMTACATINPDTTTMTGNTLGCHDYHAGVAGTAPQPANADTHCGHAGIPATAICL